MADMTDVVDTDYQPPAHRIAAIGDAWETVVERITTEADGPGTVNERLSDGGPGPDGQPATVRERLNGQPNDGHPTGEAPAQSANKPDWVDFAVSQGMDRDEAEAMTKPELIERFGN